MSVSSSSVTPTLASEAVRKYETIVIFNQSLNDQELKDEVRKFHKFIEMNGGVGVVAESWGKREIAFLIKKQKYGSYVCYSYSTSNHELTNKLTALMRITDSVLFTESHRISDKVRKVKTNPFAKPTGEFEIQIGDSDY